VPELAMAASLSDEEPTVLFHHSNNFPHFHGHGYLED
jgi:hypothetical protein